MPRLRRLSGAEVVQILEQFGFTVIRIKGSHHRLKIVRDNKTCYTSVPVHGNQPLPIGTLLDIFRQACRFIPEDDLRRHFYAN